MAGPGAGTDAADVERKVVALKDARAGVRLRPDRRVVLAVKDLVQGSESATGAGDDDRPDAGAAKEAAPAQAASPASSSTRSAEPAPEEENGKAAEEPAAEASAPPADADARPAAGAPNFHVQLELPDGSDYARNKRCVLEIPGGDPVEGTTNESGELQLFVPNLDVESATLRVFDGEAEIAIWQVMLRADASANEGQPETAA